MGVNDITGRGDRDPCFGRAGLLESVNAILLARGLKRRGLTVERNRSIDVLVHGVPVDTAFRVDLLVERCVIVELKSAESLHPVYWRQLLTCLRLLNLSVS